ncbi:hypothetical protein AB0J83_45185 [Actinoplanes sp. NPDC049596]|uniref:hypothetical protein n=1 Tax=unclassified Actinoplanes TaxID=2626549 RepID=UPI00341BC0EC
MFGDLWDGEDARHVERSRLGLGMRKQRQETACLTCNKTLLVTGQRLTEKRKPLIMKTVEGIEGRSV